MESEKSMHHQEKIQETTQTNCSETKQTKSSKKYMMKEALQELGIHKEHLTKEGYVKNIWQVTFKERLVLELIMLAPALVVLLVLFTTSNFLLTLIIFHVVLISLPLMFLKKRDLRAEWKWLLFQEILRKGGRMKHSLKLIALPVVLCMTCYMGFRRFHHTFEVESLRIPSLTESITTILLGLEFVILNPIIEEIFWRVFCDSFIGQGRTFLQKLDLSFHYAIFHWFVIYFICQDVLLSFIGFFFIWFLGYTLVITKQKAGLITAMLIHLGVDLSAGLAIWDMKSKFLSSY
jgi:hypothetical protein